MNRSIGKFFKNEYFISIITKAFSIILGFIQSVLMARYLGAELKGVNTYISSITAVSAIIITFGMHQAYPFFRKKYSKEVIYDDYISLVILVYLFYFFIASIISILGYFSFSIVTIIFLTPIAGYSQTIAYIVLIENPNKRNGYWTLICLLDVIYVACLWFYTQRNMMWGISILFFSDIIKGVVFTALLKFKFRIHSKQLKLLGEILKFGFFPMLALLMTSLNYRIDVIMLHEYDYITDAMIGVYSLGLSLSDKIFLIPDTLKGVLVSKLAKGADEHEVAKVSRLGFWIAVLISGFLIVFGKWIIDFMYGAEYRDAYSVIVITAIGTISIVYFKMIGQYNIIKGKQYLNVIMLSIAIVVDVVFNLIMIPRWGILGAAVATTIGNISCCVVFIVYFCVLTKINVGEMFFIQKSDINWLKQLKK